MSLQVLDARPDVAGGYKVDVSRGSRVGRVSSEWFSRPDDERFLSLIDLHASVKSRAAKSRTRTVESAAIRLQSGFATVGALLSLVTAATNTVSAVSPPPSVAVTVIV